MNIKEIKALAEIVSSNGFTKFKYAESDVSITIEKKQEMQVVQNYSSEVANTAPAIKIEQSPKSDSLDFNDLVEIKAPLVGVYYEASAPDASPYVQVGSKVKKGDTLCIIEAMKLMNEITAERDGEIVDICLKNGDIVEYGQVMFKIF